MKFAHPYLLNLLWTLIPLFGIMVYGIRTRKKILARFAGDGMFASVIPGFDPTRRWVKAVMITVAAGFAIVALAGPQMGFKWEKTKQKGVDIMIALDCSKSMLAQDIKPSRLERAKREIKDLLHMMKSDRAGLVAFSGRAILQCPLTLDHEAFNIFLNVLEPGFLPVGGTNLAEAIQTGFSGFEGGSDTDKAIIVITDGENTAGDVEAVARDMAKKGIKIFCIGVGDIRGAPIPDENGGFKKDRAGNIVLSKVDEQGLQKIAALTGGTYVRSVAGDMDLDLIYTDRILGTMERKTLTSGKKKVWEDRYQWFLFPCLVLLLVEFFLGSQKRIRSPKKTRSLVVFICLAGLGISAVHTTPARAETVSSSVKQGIKAFDEQSYESAQKHFIDAQLADPQNPALYYNIGAAAYMNEAYDLAKKNFMEAAKSDDPTLRHNARYNLANTNFRMGNFAKAAEGYETIIKEFPDDTQAKENLEFTRQKIEEQKQQDQQKSESDKDKNKDDGQKDPDKHKNQKDDPGDKDKKDSDQSKSDNENQSGDQQGSKDNTQNDQSQPEDQDTGDKSNEEENQPSKGGEAQNPEHGQPEKGQPGTPRTEHGEQADKNMEKLLNRLEDKPGTAMMPHLQKQDIEQDW
jgi:Ca-activated chloride channel family protein